VAYRRYRVLVKLACWLVLFVGCCVALSAWIQCQTPRLRQAANGVAERPCPGAVREDVKIAQVTKD